MQGEARFQELRQRGCGPEHFAVIVALEKRWRINNIAMESIVSYC